MPITNLQAPKNTITENEFSILCKLITSERVTEETIVRQLLKYQPPVVDEIYERVAEQNLPNINKNFYAALYTIRSNFTPIGILHSHIKDGKIPPEEFITKNNCAALVPYQIDERVIKISALHYAVLKNAPLQIFQLIINTGINIDLKDEEGYTPLNRAVMELNKNQEIINYLLENKANPNAHIPNKVSPPLHVACWNGDCAIIRLLLKYKADINFLYEGAEQSVTPLHCAVLHKEAVELLLARPDIDPNTGNREGFTPVHYTIRHEKPEVLQILLNHKNTNKKITTKVGSSYVNYAAEVGTVEMLKMMHNNGLEFHDKDNEGWLPFEMAIVKKHVDNTIYLWEVLDCKQFANSKFIRHPILNFFWIKFMLIPFLCKFEKMKTLAEKKAYTEYKQEIREQLKGLIQCGMNSVQTYSSRKSSADGNETPVILQFNFDP